MKEKISNTLDDIAAHDFTPTKFEESFKMLEDVAPHHNTVMMRQGAARGTYSKQVAATQARLDVLAVRADGLEEEREEDERGVV
jgi:hypothetical protein